MQTKKSSISKLKQLLQKSDWNKFIYTFNKVHNKHLNSSVGNVEVKIHEEKNKNK
jgi:hypothetical protein